MCFTTILNQKFKNSLYFLDCCRLESVNSNFKLHIHERDFEIGDYISRNIIKAVESSRRAIVVLSDSFIRYLGKLAWSQENRDLRNSNVNAAVNEMDSTFSLVEEKKWCYAMSNSFQAIITILISKLFIKLHDICVNKVDWLIHVGYENKIPQSNSKSQKVIQNSTKKFFTWQLQRTLGWVWVWACESKGNREQEF